MQITAAVLREPGRELELETLDLAEPKAGEVCVKIGASGVCASDLHLLDGAFPVTLGMPIVPGHEAAGVVERVGPDVIEVEPGDHVVISFYPGCGRCVTCKTGNAFACKNVYIDRMPDGTTRFSQGGQPVYHYSNVSSFAEYTIVTERGCVRMPPELPLEMACLIGCGVITGFAVVIRHTKVTVGSSVAVIGCGGVGLNILQACQLAGATKIIAVDTNQFKRDIARQFGATDTVNPGAHDPVETVREMTRGLGVDYSFEAIGVPKLIRQAYDLTAAGGTVTVVGISPPGTEVSFPAIDFGNRKTVTWASGGAANPWRDFGIIADLHRQGRWKLEELVTKRRPLDQVNEAVADLRAGRVARSVLTI